METTFNCPFSLFSQILYQSPLIHYCCLIRKDKTLWIPELHSPGMHAQNGKKMLLSHVTSDVAWGSIQGLSEFTLWMLKSLPACFMLFLKQWAFPKLMWRLARLLGFKMAWWLFFSVTRVGLTFKTLYKTFQVWF